MSVAYTVMTPDKNSVLNLENARLMVLTDFFCSWYTNKKPIIQLINGTRPADDYLRRLGLFIEDNKMKHKSDLAVIPRDFVTMTQSLNSAKTIICGRLLSPMSLELLLPDFGGDTLRLYFLYLGPPGRDYEFHWEQLAGLYKFVQKTWYQGKNFRENMPNNNSSDELKKLKETVYRRIKQEKPHTALAAVMKFLKDKDKLGKSEVLTVAKLLRPYTPFLSAELISFITSIEINNGWQSNKTND